MNPGGAWKEPAAPRSCAHTSGTAPAMLRGESTESPHGFRRQMLLLLLSYRRNSGYKAVQVFIQEPTVHK